MDILQEVRKKIVVYTAKEKSLTKRINLLANQIESDTREVNLESAELNSEQLVCLYEEYVKVAKTLKESVLQLNINDTHVWN
tara:strand:- start:4758 stop:5003 length:246 start_codon:yes stop_codon:yes gene_type:complete